MHLGNGKFYSDITNAYLICWRFMIVLVCIWV